MARPDIPTSHYAVWHRVERAVVVTAARIWFSFWMIPAALSLLAAGVSEVLVTYSTSIDAALDGVVFWFPVGVSGSRDILTAISGAMLTVAATTFSITIAVLVLTSSNFGPRLVRSFMADRGNQAVLGVFVATFLYCLLTLRSIRSEAVGDDGTFVPVAAVNFALTLAVLCVAVLIWFIHHISNAIQVWTLADGLARELEARVRVHDQVFDAMRQYATDHPIVVDRALLTAEVVGGRARDRAVTARILDQVEMLVAACEGDMTPDDLARVRERCAAVRRSLEQRLAVLA